MKKIFIGAPFTMYLKDNTFRKKPKIMICKIIEIIKELKVEMYSAHLNENWGTIKISPQQIVNNDLNNLKKCTHFICYLINIKSIGTLIELGVAISLKKEILLISKPEIYQKSDFVAGLTELKFVRFCNIDEHNVSDCIREFITK